MACAHVQPATVKAHAPVCKQVSNIRLWPSPREDIGATNEATASAALLNKGSRPLITAEIQTATSNAGLSHRSTLIETALEYHLCGAITSELLLRGHRFELLRVDRDLSGYDLVIEANGVLRHIQLKGQVAGGANREFSVQTALVSKPSACVIWMTYDPLTLRPVSWRYFGGEPGKRIRPLGTKIGKHTRGSKGFRLDHRIIPAKEFEKIASVEHLVDRLFGTINHEIASLLTHMADQPEPAEPWLAAVRTGDFRAIPEQCDPASAADLAHLIDGYALLEAQGCRETDVFADQALSVATQAGRWPGGPRDLWIALFLEHRRWRLASPLEPDPSQQALLDTLVRQLREALTA